MEKCGLELLDKTTEISEFRWYLYDIINEIMDKDGIEKSKFSLDEERKEAVCLTIKEGGLIVSGIIGEASKQHDDFYHAVCDFFKRLYKEDEKAEEAVSCFLTRTLDLPSMMKKPSLSMLKDQFYRCQKEIKRLQEKIKKEPGKKEEMKLSLDRLYLKGLKDKIKKHYGKTI